MQLRSELSPALTREVSIKYPDWLRTAWQTRDKLEDDGSFRREERLGL